jgi:hypothetical protein
MSRGNLGLTDTIPLGLANDAAYVLLRCRAYGAEDAMLVATAKTTIRV